MTDREAIFRRAIRRWRMTRPCRPRMRMTYEDRIEAAAKLRTYLREKKNA